MEPAQEQKNVAKLSASNPASMRHLDSVSKVHAANRLAEIAEFLCFTARALLRRRHNFTSIVPAINDMKKLILDQKPEGQGNKGMAYDPDSKAPSPEVFEKFMSVVRLDSPDNPYKSIAVRTRNALMFDVLYETGMRSGEVLALRVGDVDFNAGKISILRRHDDLLDPRKQQPVAKTLARNLDIPIDLARRIRAYVMEIRSQVVTAKSPPFLFVTLKRGRYQGQPISDTAFRNRILGPVISTNSEMFEEITRHGFRHNHNYRFSKKVDANNALSKINPAVALIGEKAERDARMLQYGWSSEQTAQTYNVRHTREIVKKVMRADGEELATHLKKGKKKHE
jgi:integrase